jgi:hypothetical protein
MHDGMTIMSGAWEMVYHHEVGKWTIHDDYCLVNEI